MEWRWLAYHIYIHVQIYVHYNKSIQSDRPIGCVNIHEVTYCSITRTVSFEKPAYMHKRTWIKRVKKIISHRLTHGGSIYINCNSLHFILSQWPRQCISTFSLHFPLDISNLYVTTVNGSSNVFIRTTQPSYLLGI